MAGQPERLALFDQVLEVQGALSACAVELEKFNWSSRVDVPCVPSQELLDSLRAVRRESDRLLGLFGVAVS